MPKPREFSDTVELMKRELRGAMARRGRFNWVTTEGTQACVAYERGWMWAAVTEERKRLGKPWVALVSIIAAENAALGHCDYADKFALYCAEIVHDTFAK